MKRTTFIQKRQRRGAMTMEVVMSTGVMIPIAFGLLLLGTEMCRYVYGLVSSLVTWPFL